MSEPLSRPEEGGRPSLTDIPTQLAGDGSGIAFPEKLPGNSFLPGFYVCIYFY